MRNGLDMQLGDCRLRLKTCVGLAISALGALIVCSLVWRGFVNTPAALPALVGGSAAALATALGTIPVLLSHHPSQRMQDALFGFGAGVMLAASAFSLVLPGIASAHAALPASAPAWHASLIIGAAILLGALALKGLDHALPHEHFIKGREGATAQQLRRTWLFVFAIGLHNLPEGMAIGVGYAGSEGVRANALAMGIAIQDIPEGFIVAAALLAAGYGRVVSAALGMATGLVEPIGAVLGAIAFGDAPLLLPWGLGIAAGAMLFVVSHEIIPESHRKGHESLATTGLIAGFVLMLVLDTAF